MYLFGLRKRVVDRGVQLPSLGVRIDHVSFVQHVVGRSLLLELSLPLGRLAPEQTQKDLTRSPHPHHR